MKLPKIKGKKAPKEKKGFFKKKQTEDEKVRSAVSSLNKKKKKRLERNSLQEYLGKAGYSVNAEKLKKNTLKSLVVIFMVGSLALVGYSFVVGVHWLNLLIFLFGVWTAIFAGVVLFLLAATYFFLDYRIYERTRELEAVLPDFLQLASSNIAAGMPIDRALWYSIRPNFGVLAKEMEQVAKATMAGDNLEKSLVDFTKKYDSKLLQRSISILIEGLHAGGEMADLLDKIALNIEDLKIMKKEMAANVTTYAIFILFASIIIAPFLFGLATQLLQIIVDITSSLDLSSSSSSMFTISAADASIVGNFKIFSVLMLLVTSIFSAAIVSVIRRGNVMEGVKTMPIYALVSVMMYYLSLSFLSGVFGGLI